MDHFATVSTRANQMITSMRRFGWASFFAGLVLSWATTGHAGKNPVPLVERQAGLCRWRPRPVSGARIPDQTARAILTPDVLRGRRQEHRPAGSRHQALCWRIVQALANLPQAAASSRNFDADRSVIIVLAIDNKQVAVHPGALLRSRFGLSATKIKRDLIDKVFIDEYGLKGKFPEGLAALVNATNDAIAERDELTARAPFKFTATGSPKTQSKSTSSPAKSVAGPIQTRTSREADAQNLPVQSVRSSNGWMTAWPWSFHDRGRARADRWCPLVGISPHPIRVGAQIEKSGPRPST